MKIVSILFFSFISYSLSFKLRDTAIGEWDVFPADSDFTHTSYTIEFHQSSNSPLESNLLNCTLWKDESMHSFTPSAFVFSLQGPLAASMQIVFNSDFSGSIYNIKSNNLNQESDSKIQVDFSFDSKSEISKFQIGKYIFVVDISQLAKDGKATVEVSSSLNDNDNSLIESRNKFIVKRTNQFETNKPIKEEKTINDYAQSFNKINEEKEEKSPDFYSSISQFFNNLQIDTSSNNALLLILISLFMIIAYLISKIVAFCLCPPKNNKKAKTTDKKSGKHKKREAKNKKEKVAKENANNEKAEEKIENEIEGNKEKVEKTKTD